MNVTEKKDYFFEEREKFTYAAKEVESCFLASEVEVPVAASENEAAACWDLLLDLLGTCRVKAVRRAQSIFFP
jgi:hypothetical protein